MTYNIIIHLDAKLIHCTNIGTLDFKGKLMQIQYLGNGWKLMGTPQNPFAYFMWILHVLNSILTWWILSTSREYFPVRNCRGSLNFQGTWLWQFKRAWPI